MSNPFIQTGAEGFAANAADDDYAEDIVEDTSTDEEE